MTRARLPTIEPRAGTDQPGFRRNLVVLRRAFSATLRKASSPRDERSGPVVVRPRKSAAFALLAPRRRRERPGLGVRLRGAPHSCCLLVWSPVVFRASFVVVRRAKLRQAKIGQLCIEASIQENVRGLEITIDHWRVGYLMQLHFSGSGAVGFFLFFLDSDVKGSSASRTVPPQTLRNHFLFFFLFVSDVDASCVDFFLPQIQSIHEQQHARRRRLQLRKFLQQHARRKRLQLRKFLQPHLLAELNNPMELLDRRESYPLASKMLHSWGSIWHIPGSCCAYCRTLVSLTRVVRCPVPVTGGKPM
ncbi:hypothetical protein EJB05_36234, partial [Eragrostis curvula]